MAFDTVTGEWIDEEPVVVENPEPEKTETDENQGEPEPTGKENDDHTPEITTTGQEGDPTNAEPEPDDDLKTRLKKLEDQNAALHRRLNKTAKKPAFKIPEPVDDGTAPKIDDFDTVNDYEAAKRAWDIDKRVADGVRKALQSDPVDEHTETLADIKADLVSKGPAKYADFMDVAGAKDLAITDQMLLMIGQNDSETVSPEDILYYLGKNKSEAARLSRMKSTALAREIIKIENTITEAAKKAGRGGTRPPKSKAKDTTSAPDPITPTGGDTKIIVGKDPDKMSQAEYEAWRAAGGGN